MDRGTTTCIVTFLVSLSCCGGERGDGFLLREEKTDNTPNWSTLVTSQPRIDRVLDAVCGTAGGCEVTVEGRSFLSGVQLLIDGQPAPHCSTVTINKLVCTVPAKAGGPGPVDLVVHNEPTDMTSKKFALWDRKFFYMGLSVDPWPMRTLRTRGVPKAAAVADLNGDTYPDIAVISEGRNAVEVFLGQPGSRAFAPSVEIDVGTAPSALSAADLDGDSRSDLVVANAGSDNLTLLWSNLGAPYSAVRVDTPLDNPSGLPPCKKPQDVSIAYLNPDSRLDIAITCLGETGVRPSIVDLINMGSRVMKTYDYDYADIAPRLIRALNINNDGYTDVVIMGTATKTMQYAYLDSAWTFTKLAVPSPIAALKSIEALDTGKFDGDAFDDIALIDTGLKTLYVLKNITGAFTIHGSPLAVRDRYTKLRTMDIDGDGKLDLLASDPQTDKRNAGETFLGNGDATFRAHQVLSWGFPVPRTELGYVDSDTLPDLLLLGADTPYTSEDDDGKVIHILLNSGGTFRTPVRPLTLPAGATTPMAMVVANLDADPEAELAILNRKPGKLIVMDEALDGSFGEKASANLPEDGDAMSLSDDTKTLAILHSNANKFSVLKKDVGGGFAIETTNSTRISGVFASDIAIGQFTSPAVGDEIRISLWDISVKVPRVDRVAGFTRGRPSWTPRAVRAMAKGEEPVALSRALIAGAGTLPWAIFANAASNQVGLLGPGMTMAETLDTGNYPLGLVACDLDAQQDGNDLPDLISADAADNTVTVLWRENTPSHAWTPLPAIPVCKQPTALWCGHINVDSLDRKKQALDLVVACDGNGPEPPSIEVLFGGANGTFLPEHIRLPRPGSGPLAVIADAAGLRMILSADQNTGTVWAVPAGR